MFERYREDWTSIIPSTYGSHLKLSSFFVANLEELSICFSVEEQCMERSIVHVDMPLG